MRLYDEWRERVDKAGFDDTHSPLWIVQHHDRVIFDRTSSNVAIGGADMFRKTQEEARQIHGMCPKINHCTSGCLLRIEKIGWQPTLGVLRRSECAIMRDAYSNLCDLAEQFALQNIFDS